MKLHQVLKDYFSFTRGERIGLTVLLILIVLVMVANQVIFYFERPIAPNREMFERLVAEYEAAQTLETEQLSLFSFDPNTIDSITFFQFDLPQRVKRNWLNYRRHGGKIRKKEDFARIYGMNDSLYRVVEPYLQLADAQSAGERRDYPTQSVLPEESNIKQEESPMDFEERVYSKAPLQTVELNSASESELEALPGIGSVLSKRIVKYRDLLGGFSSVGQLVEVYGLKPEIVELNCKNMTVDTAGIRRLDLNFLTVEELAKHPYLNFKEARKIVDFRSKNGYISNKYQLLNDSVIEQNLFRKLVFYLK